MGYTLSDLSDKKRYCRCALYAVLYACFSALMTETPGRQKRYIDDALYAPDSARLGPARRVYRMKEPVLTDVYGNNNGKRLYA